MSKLAFSVPRMLLDLLFIILIVMVAVFMLFLGFRKCWHCNTIKHSLSMKNYINSDFDMREKVCESCYKTLSKVDDAT